MGTVHQFPVPRKQKDQQPEEALARALRLAVDAKVGAAEGFAAREAAAVAVSNEATRLFLRDYLVAIAEGHGAQVEVDGRIYQRHERATVRYYPLCGTLDIER